jgi:hypothetical protein
MKQLNALLWISTAILASSACAKLTGADDFVFESVGDSADGGEAARAGAGAGTGGAAGKGGSAAMSGGAGTSGGAGMSGSAGTSGRAGTSGSAGTSGGAGTSGSAGTGGQGVCDECKTATAPKPGSCRSGTCSGAGHECDVFGPDEGKQVACMRCDGTSPDPVRVADNTQDQLCNSDCMKCSAGACVIQTATEDLFEQCHPPCATDSCSGSKGACGALLTGERGLAACQRCDGLSADPVNFTDGAQDTEGPDHFCRDTCQKCSGGKCVGATGYIEGYGCTTVCSGCSNGSCSQLPAGQQDTLGNNKCSGSNACDGNGQCVDHLVNGSTHSPSDCTSANGILVATDVAGLQCQFPVATCPSGWTQYKNYSTTTRCTAPSSGCLSGEHTFSNTLTEQSYSCLYETGAGCASGVFTGECSGASPCPPTRVPSGTLCQQQSCSAKVTQVGCY